MLKKAVSSASDLQQLINGVSSLGIDGSSSSSTWKPSAIATGTQGTVNRSADDLVLGEKHEYHLPAALYKKLYAHQGLGKTMQCSAFLTGLLGSRLAKRALIIAPKTLLLHWEKELGLASPQSQRAPGAGEWAWDYMILDEGHKSARHPELRISCCSS
ncbi:helicase ATP-binding domain-containing protein [Haematococcus lacustris]|uniref:Helicase ATP-binding domain-containing protein n=1 Tax=Haematococcus lacustris TaxID=44745 RepID=A0A6A0A0T9_HAELA|nr:helicase ATP-binding domain-containing protein [Haematococcus lacustris]